MVVNKNTRISLLIKENPKVIDTIASINKHFKKLKNPVLRKVLAPRVSIEDAAKIGGVTVEEFLNKIAEAGFEIEIDSNEVIEVENSQKNIDFMKNNTDLVTLDVRPIIESGNDPFNEIMTIVKTLKIGETLEIINSFEPIPLIHKLKNKGFTTWTNRKNDNLVHTYFKKEDENQVEDEIAQKVTESFDETYKTFVGKMNYVDVRHLEMPEPMTRILQELEQLPKGHALFVDHKKIPQFLLPELKERNFEIIYNKKSENHLQLLIFKK